MGHAKKDRDAEVSLMKIYRRVILSLTLTSLVLAHAGTNERTASVAANDSTPCPKLGSLIRRLRSSSQKTRDRAKNEVLVLGKQSPNSRQCVISTMRKIFAKVIRQHSNGLMFAVRSPRSYRQWSEVTDTLGTMKATEALDLLIDNLDYNNGTTTLGVGHFPAARATVAFGDEAIPGLLRALKNGSVTKKYLAAFTLREIGGDKAKQALVRAISEEKDVQTSADLNNLLQNWK